MHLFHMHESTTMNKRKRKPKDKSPLWAVIKSIDKKEKLASFTHLRDDIDALKHEYHQDRENRELADAKHTNLIEGLEDVLRHFQVDGFNLKRCILELKEGNSERLRMELTDRLRGLRA